MNNVKTAKLLRIIAKYLEMTSKLTTCSSTAIWFSASTHLTVCACFPKYRSLALALTRVECCNA